MRIILVAQTFETSNLEPLSPPLLTISHHAYDVSGSVAQQSLRLVAGPTPINPVCMQCSTAQEVAHTCHPCFQPCAGQDSLCMHGDACVDESGKFFTRTRSALAYSAWLSWNKQLRSVGPWCTING